MGQAQKLIVLSSLRSMVLGCHRLFMAEIYEKDVPVFAFKQAEHNPRIIPQKVEKRF